MTIQFSVYAASCPTRQALDRITGKWTALVVGLLEERPYQFGELEKKIGGISKKVLAQTLRDLERDGLVFRRVMRSRPPMIVEYSLSPLGRTLSGPLAAIREWAERYVGDMLAARQSPTNVSTASGSTTVRSDVDRRRG
jgi:DNA-binding HxlR family transcriptional regulator